MIRAAGYIRVSDKEQADGFSLDAQEDAIRLACTRKGYDLVGIFADRGISARYDTIERRTQFAAMLSAAEHGGFDVAVVHTLDRFARNLKVKLLALERFAKAGVGFVSVQEDMDFTTPHGRLFLQQMGSYNEFFSNMLGVHVKKGLHERAREGYGNGDVPFGYRRCQADGGLCNDPTCGGGVHIEAAEAEEVRRLFARYVAGSTQTDLARSLNAAGFRTRNKIDRGRGAGPQLFTGWSLRDILANPFYAGQVRWHGVESFQGLQQAIVSQNLWRQAQDAKASRWGRSRTFSSATRAYLLKGLLACAMCGERYWSEMNHGHAFYRGQRRAQDCRCAGVMVHCEKVDAAVSLLIYALTLPDDWMEEARSRVVARNLPDGVARAASLKERRTRLARAYVDGAYRESEYRRELADVDTELRAIEIGQAGVSTSRAAAMLLTDLEHLWADAGTSRRHTLLAALVDSIYIDATGRVVGVSPKPEVIPLFAALVTKPESGVIMVAMSSVQSRESSNAVAGMVETGESSTPSRQPAESPWLKLGSRVRERFGLHFVILPQAAEPDAK